MKKKLLFFFTIFFLFAQEEYPYDNHLLINLGTSISFSKSTYLQQNNNSGLGPNAKFYLGIAYSFNVKNSLLLEPSIKYHLFSVGEYKSTSYSNGEQTSSSSENTSHHINTGLETELNVYFIVHESFLIGGGLMIQNNEFIINRNYTNIFGRSLNETIVTPSFGLRFKILDFFSNIKFSIYEFNKTVNNNNLKTSNFNIAFGVSIPIK